MNIYDFKVAAQDGSEVSLDQFKGKTILVVNTATGCGFTPQYSRLEDIYEKYDMLKLGRLRKDLLINALRTMKRMNLIQNLDRLDSCDMGMRIQIYPSILFAVTAGSLDEIYKIAQDKLTEYEAGGDFVDADNGTINEELD